MTSCPFDPQGDDLATHKVNLDALIPRENFESGTASPGMVGDNIHFKVDELDANRNFLSVLRKPDFQRQTNNWTPEMVVDFVQSFLDEKFIPSIIIWKSRATRKIFIVDGAHRVSALIAWVNDDYGDGIISRRYFSDVGKLQKDFHAATKALMDKKVGDYQRVFKSVIHPDNADQVMVGRGRTAAARTAPVQLVDGDAATAEESFLKINSNPTTIDATELDVIRARRKPNVIATRAIINRGTGHRDWVKFGAKGKEIEDAAVRAFDLIFGPIHELTQQSPDIPRAGQPYSQEALRMVFDMVNIFNGVTPSMWGDTDDAKNTLLDDTDGEKTLEFVKQIEDLGKLVADNSNANSYGLDQAVYSYGATGKFHPAAFLASLQLAKEFEETKKRVEFTRIRKDFEEFLVHHKKFINKLTSAKGSRTRPLASIIAMHRIVIDAMIGGNRNHSSIVEIILREPRFKSLRAVADDGEIDEEVEVRPRKGKPKFSKTARAVALVREILANRGKCTECGARLPPHARSKDHIKRAEDGGTGHSDNLAFTHPWCNTTYKELRVKGLI